MEHDGYHSASIRLETRLEGASKPFFVAWCGPIKTLCQLLGEWHHRERERCELSMMSRRDFGDLPACSLGAVRDEVRRWPWQKPALR